MDSSYLQTVGDRIHNLQKTYELKEYPCYLCAFSSPTINIVIDHIRQHDNIRSLQCGYCNEQYLTLEEYEEHVKWAHISRKRLFDSDDFNEPERARMTTPEMPNDQHITIHKEATYKCNQCDKTFVTPHGLYLHKRNIHIKVKYPCNQCAKIFTTQSGLKYHTRNIHEGLINTCDQCEKTFTTPSGLIKHRHNAHEGLRYACDKCDKIFTASSNLNSHKRKYHVY